MKRAVLALAALAAAAALAALHLGGGSGESPGAAAAVPGLAVTLYTDPYCGCCREYAEYLEDAGARVEVVVVDREALAGLKERLGVPRSLWSCHTALAEVPGGAVVVVEGHVPLEAVADALEAGVAGVAVPGMPPGSPGMPGDPGPITVYYYNAAGAVGVLGVYEPSASGGWEPQAPG